MAVIQTRDKNMDNLNLKYCHTTLSKRKNLNFQSNEKKSIIAYFFV